MFFLLLFFFFNDTATTEIYTLSLHDALPILSRNSIISRNFQVVSTCSSLNGGLPGWKAFSASCIITAESLPMEYSITGLSNSAATSRMMWIASASSCLRWVSWYLAVMLWFNAVQLVVTARAL